MYDKHEEQYRVAVFLPTQREDTLAVSILDGVDSPERDVRRYRGVLTVWCSAAELAALQAQSLTVDVLRAPIPRSAPAAGAPADGAPADGTAPAGDAPAGDAAGDGAPAGGAAAGTTAPDRFVHTRPVSEGDPFVDRLRDQSDRVRIGGEAQPGLVVKETDGQFRESVNDMYLVSLHGPMHSRRRDRLAELGIEVSEFEPPDGYWMYLSPPQRTALRDEWWVRDMKPWTLARTVSAELITMLREAPTAPEQPALLGGADEPAVPDQYDVLLHRAEDLEWLRGTVAATEETEVVFAIDVMLRFRTLLTGDRREAMLAAIARLHEVRMVAPYQPPTLYVDHARALIGLAALNERSDPPGRWTGQGQVVAVFDSGIDAAHPDLADRIIAKQALVGGSPDDHLGHGTHVAGIIAGTGHASAGAVVGCAPGAHLAAFRVTDDNGRVQVPPCVGLFLRHAVDVGAKVINLSWGNAMSGTYDMYALSVDKFVHEHPDVLVVVAAGNDGQAPKGHHLFNTIGTPATAKNALTVGASVTDRPEFQAKTWSVLRAAKFPMPPAGAEHVAGTVDAPAAISSRGPTDYDSVKPDLLAPGTFILSTRLSGGAIDPRLVWADCADYDGHYVYIGGTSMAAPAVAGAAAVLRQYLAAEHNCPQPQAALIKAILIAATRRIPPLRDTQTWEDVGYPDFDQGYGRLDLRTVLPCSDAAPDRRLVFRDIPNDHPDALEAFAPVGGARQASREYVVTVTGSAEPLRIVLAWTDHPGNAIQNNLNLGVVDPGGDTHVGNEGHTFHKKEPGFDRQPQNRFSPHQLDKLNSVEHILLPSPAPGEYRIQVLAQRTTFPPQGYALVVCGQLGSDLSASL